jgi:hypothetical protein
MKSRWCSSPLCSSARVVAPRCGCGLTLPESPLIPTILVLVFVLLWSAPVSAAILEGHTLGRASGTDLIMEPTLEFTRDDMVASEVSLSAAEKGDLLQWVFTGPQGMHYNESQTLTPGLSTARVMLDLSLLPSDEAVGSWTLDLFLNEEPAARQDFTVEPLTGLVW